jgi:hypothetical protein
MTNGVNRSISEIAMLQQQTGLEDPLASEEIWPLVSLAAVAKNGVTSPARETRTRWDHPPFASRSSHRELPISSSRDSCWELCGR